MNSKRIDFDLLSIALFAFIINAMAATLLVFRLNIYAPDNLARASSALASLFGIDTKINNIGFARPPLVTLLQIPLVVFPPFRYNGLSGNIISVLSGAAVAVMLALFLRRANVAQAMRWLIVAAFILNPMIVFYSANGQTEMTYFFLVLVAVYLYWRWRDESHWTFLAGSSVAAGLAILTRYDAVFITAGLAFVIGLEGMARRPDDARFGESLVLLFVTPAAYLGLLWLAANWAFVGSPFYFLRAHEAQIGIYLASHPDLLPLKGDFAASFLKALSEGWILFPAFLPLSAALFLLAMARRSWHWVGTLMVVWSLVLFSAFALFMGWSPAQLRFFMAVIPMSFVLAAGILQLLKASRQVVALILAATFVVSGYASAQTMLRAEGSGERAFVEGLIDNRPAQGWQAEQELAQYINTQTIGQVLVDTEHGSPIIAFSGRANRFITPDAPMFDTYLRTPLGNVSYILAWNWQLTGYKDRVNQAYQDLYDLGGDWVSLEKASGDWKLYRVVGPPGAAPAEQPPPP